MRSLIAIVVALVGFSGCRAVDNRPTPIFHAETNPALLSDWGVLEIQRDHLNLGERVIAYDLNTPLFSDYASKLRTVWMPEGQSADYHETDSFRFPVGTIISKTFYYSVEEGHVLKQAGNDPLESLEHIRMIETRILAKREAGWTALPYVWNSDQTEARLKRTGDIVPLTLNDGGQNIPFNYVVPNINQCAGCHAFNNTTRELRPIGPKARHLNRDDQLQAWYAAGYLDKPLSHTPQSVDVSDRLASINAKARAYLDINCSHCHNTKGPADTSGLHYEPETPMGSHLGLCKTPVAAGGGTGDKPYDLVPGAPDQSIMLYRMQTTDPGHMMPELGRALAHAEGIALISDWISGMDGGCE